MECQYCEHYRKASKRYVKQVGEIVKWSRRCPETKRIVIDITESCSSFILASYIWCPSTYHWVQPKQICAFKPYIECKRCQVVKTLKSSLDTTGRLKRIPTYTKTRKYPKVKLPPPQKPKGGGGNGKKVKHHFTALDAALDAANANSYLSTSANEYELVNPTTPLDLLLRKERLENCLSKDAATVVQLVLSRPEKVSNLVTGRITKCSITNYLRSNGWAHKVIAGSFQELKAIAATF